MKKTICLLVLSTISFNLYAAETDQFYAKNAVIRDSANEFNDYFHEKIQLGLDKSNEEKVTPTCRQVAKKVLAQVLGEPSVIEYAKDRTFSKISKFTQHSPLIDRFPPDSMKGGAYRKDSMYKNRPFPINIVGISRTVNINGIYVGTDKLGHFSIVGKRYYSDFLKSIADGSTEAEAEKIAIEKGFSQEIALLGYTVGGVMGYGDLEANYRGYVFGRDMCEGDQPLLKLTNGKWTQNPDKMFDIRTYVNPKWDEAYNVSFWSPWMWRNMSDDIIKAYCENKVDSDFLKRKERYDSIDKDSINDQLIAEFLKEKPKFDRKNQLLSPSIKCN